MSLAIGGSPGMSTSAHGDLWFDIRSFGAKADNGVTDNSIPIQAAIDALAAKLITSPRGSKGVIYVPCATSPYVVNKTIWVDSGNIEIRGDGWGSQVQMSPYAKHSTFLFGVRRVETNYGSGSYRIDSSNRPDLFGKLDNSAITGPGQKWGIRTNSSSFVQIQASPMSAGPRSKASPYDPDFWTETTQLTVEFFVEPPNGQLFPTNAPLLGMGNTFYQPSPFVVSIWDDPNKVFVTFKTADFDHGYNQGCRYFTFSLAGATPPFRVVFQIDLDNASCSAFVNGIQVSFTSSGNLSPNVNGTVAGFVPNSGLRFIQNDYFPLMIGSSDFHGPLGNSGSTGVDLRLYGLRFSNTIRYQNNGPGHLQTRVDSPNTAVNDTYAYFTDDAHTIGFLLLTDDPANAGRVVTVQQGGILANGGAGSGLFLNVQNGGGIAGNAIRDIRVISGNGHGQAISLGGVLEMTIENVQATGGFHGIGSLNYYANYHVYVNNCWLEGHDSAYYGCYQLMSARDIYIGNFGKVAVRLIGCSSNWESTLVAFPGANSECFFKYHTADYGGNHRITGLQTDFEGLALTLAAIYCEAHSLTPATSLVLSDIFHGTVGSKTALVMLKDTGPLGSFNRAWISINNMQAYTYDYLAALDIDGPLWFGEMTGVALGGPQFNHRGKWGTKSNIIIRDSKYIAPPRKFPWYVGTHVLEVRSPVDGQFSEWRCLASGTYGSPTPPTWLGLNPLFLTANALAAYVGNCSYVQCLLT